MALRIVFMGTPQFSVPVLEAIVAAGHNVVGVYTQPPRPAGRGMAEQKSPVHVAAQSHGIGVSTPRNFKAAEDREAFAALKADAAVVVAYGLLLPKEVLDAPRLGCFNVHASRLPRWRGAAPIQRAIMAGDKETAVMVMRMEEGLDTGPICLSASIPIGPQTTAGTLHDELSAAGAPLMVEALKRLEAGTLTETPQPVVGVTYAAKIDKREARIDFARPANLVAVHIRGLSPFPGAWLELAGKTPERLKVLNAEEVPGTGTPGEVIGDDLTIACTDGAVRLTRVQRAGKKPVSAEEFLRGFTLPVGTRLS
ncbi:MAG: methionyl-tRNA formyltransferase [Hyphomicrobiaceae bacterium]|nr:methionyl-tRNA formyltransferase [Hyphomicrobiaceae bacterium]